MLRPAMRAVRLVVLDRSQVSYYGGSCSWMGIASDKGICRCTHNAQRNGIPICIRANMHCGKREEERHSALLLLCANSVPSARARKPQSDGDMIHTHAHNIAFMNMQMVFDVRTWPPLHARQYCTTCPPMHVHTFWLGKWPWEPAAGCCRCRCNSHVSRISGTWTHVRFRQATPDALSYQPYPCAQINSMG